MSTELPPSPREPARGGAVWLMTDHWALIAVTESMSGLFAEFHNRNGAHFALGMHLSESMTSEEYWTPVLRTQVQEMQHGVGVYLAGFTRGVSGRPQVGCAINFSRISRGEFESCWLGYRLDKELEGRSLMYEAVSAALQLMFDRYSLHRIAAFHDPTNTRSARLLRRLGFSVEGYSRDFVKMNGEWRDSVLLARLANDSK